MNYKGSNKFGVLPRRTMIANQPHMLAYINPQEEMLLRKMGGTGQAGPMGVPAYPPNDGGFSPDGGGGYGGGGALEVLVEAKVQEVMRDHLLLK